MSVSPSVWGKSLWISIYSIVFSLSEILTNEEKDSVISFFQSLSVLLPCEDCREHYKIHLLENPLTCDTREELENWIVTLNDSVNARTGKRRASLVSIKKKLIIQEETVKKIEYKPKRSPGFAIAVKRKTPKKKKCNCKKDVEITQ